MSRSPVFAVCGIPGSGKTTLCNAIQRTTGAALVSYDRYENITQTPPDELAAWLASGADFADIQAPGLSEAIDAASQAALMQLIDASEAHHVGPDASVFEVDMTSVPDGNVIVRVLK